MKKQLACFAAVAIATTANLFATIVEAPNLEELSVELQQLDSDALVVFDVDLTLIVPQDRILSPSGEKYWRKKIEQLNSLGEQGRKLISIILLQSKVSLVNEGSRHLIEMLKL